MSRTGKIEKRYAPAGLQQLIDLVNSVPPEMDLPAEIEGSNIIERLQGESFRRFRELTGPVEPDTFLRRLVGPGAPDTWNKAIGNYLFLREAREWLRSVAKVGEFNRAVVRSSEFAGLKGPRWSAPPYTRLSVSFQTDDKGRLHFNLSPPVALLEGVEATRIRLCPICNNIFWAARKDQGCCRTRCGNVARIRRWRENYSKKYKLQRYQKAEQTPKETEEC